MTTYVENAGITGYEASRIGHDEFWFVSYSAADYLVWNISARTSRCICLPHDKSEYTHYSQSGPESGYVTPCMPMEDWNNAYQFFPAYSALPDLFSGVCAECDNSTINDYLCKDCRNGV